MTGADWLLLGIIGAVQMAFAALGYGLGYLTGVRAKADVTSDAVAAALPALVEKIELEFETQRVTVPVTVVATAEISGVPPVYIPVETYPAPTNIELARRIFAELGDIGSRPLADILSIAPSSAHAIRTRLLAETPGGAAVADDKTDTEEVSSTNA